MVFVVAVYNRATGKATSRDCFDNPESAQRKAQTLETDTVSDPSLEVCLFFGETLDALRTSHSRYFQD
jgi:hypothetical protein